ncbi:DUF6221 family protein [Streptomyces sp. NPDC058985]|uniref:DUF6221 family protein n=1 Tax=Streptomyces sp. NPDC058985 TaxID=3346684 RepID=UPI0036B70960
MENDILSWLDWVISEREDAATAAAVPHGQHWVQGFPEQHKDPDLRYGWDADMVHLSQTDPHIAYQCLSDEIAALTVLHDPEAVLRRCAADRKLLELHQAVDCGAFGCDCGLKCRTCDWTASQETGIDAGWGEVDQHIYPCPTVRAIAEGYGWTEGER